MRVVTFKISEELLEEVDRIALKYRTNRSAVIRTALRKFIESEGVSVKREVNVKRVTLK